MSSFENFPIDLGTLPSGEHLEFHPLQPAYKWILVINTLFFFVFLIGGTVLAYVLNSEEIPSWIFYLTMAVWVIALAFRSVLMLIAFNKRGWLIRTHDVVYQKGILRYTMVTVPFTRIQHSEIRQSAVARMFGLAKVRIFTAGGMSSDLTIPGLSYEQALQLKDYLSNVIGRE